MSHYGTRVEYGIHCLLHLSGNREGEWTSAKEVADFQGISPAYTASLFTKLQKSGIVRSAEGGGGGYRLARPASEISVLDAIDALEPRKRLFECREIRRDCVLHGGDPPGWVGEGLCAVHATILAAERAMREQLGQTTLDSLADQVSAKAPKQFAQATREWFARRKEERRPGPHEAGSADRLS